MKMFVAMVSGLLLSSAALAQHVTGASTNGNETSEPAGNGSGNAASNATSSSSEAGQTSESGERLICRRINNTETRLRRTRVCLTAEQWRREARGN